jgi:hypothetical protein
MCNKIISHHRCSGDNGIFYFLFFLFKGISTVIPAGEGRLNIYNGYDCDVHARSLSLNVDRIIQPLGMMNVNYALVSREDVFEIILKFDRECTFVPENFELNTTVTVSEGKVSRLFSLN